jgi:ferric-dicitrate binding protein FerR (iron transport regulator)
MPEGVKIMHTIDAESDWLYLQKNFPRTGHTFLFRTIYRMAACFLIVALVCYGYWLQQESSDATRIVLNDGGTVKSVLLPDSSEVYLNIGSSIQYSTDFMRNRTVALTGEAFFNVTHDAQHPFTVTARNCEVKVLGTSFNVNPLDSALEVAVETGKVYFLGPQKRSSLLLTPGNKGTYDFNNASLQQNTNKDLNYLSWQTHMLRFENTSLQDVIADLEKYFHVSIQFQYSNKIVPTYTSTFTNPTLNEVLHEMQMVLPITYQQNSNMITIEIK